jgi:hypothetical protein|tara:strand:+ start:373 stop:744 length:372 start_codon:yes stop_codon:yes gene_type:complete
MGTLTATLILKDSTTFSDELNFSISKEITTAAPAQMLKLVSVANSATEVLYADSGSAGTAFVYIKNANTSNSYSVDIKTDGASTYGTLDNGEFAFIPIDTNEGVEVTAAGGTVSVEFAFFTKA